MKSFALLTAVLLTGCASTVVKQVPTTFPDAPAELLTACPDLTKLPQDPKLSDVAKNVVINYNTYYQCASKNDAWIEWYNTQRQINTDAAKKLSGN